jgi:hypothetical protein
MRPYAVRLLKSFPRQGLVERDCLVLLLLYLALLEFLALIYVIILIGWLSDLDAFLMSLFLLCSSALFDEVLLLQMQHHLDFFLNLNIFDKVFGVLLLVDELLLSCARFLR